MQFINPEFDLRRYIHCLTSQIFKNYKLFFNNIYKWIDKLVYRSNINKKNYYWSDTRYQSNFSK